jgi:hypothetical protein
VKSLASVKKDVDEIISAWKTHLLTKGAPLIVGEWGTSTEDAYTNYRSNMVQFYRYFIEQTKAAGITAFHWMGLTDGADRSVPKFTQPDLLDAIIKGYYGDGGYTGIENGVLREDSVIDVYSINGICLYRKVKRSDIAGMLPKGIYIVNGKKFVVVGK